MKKLKSIWVFSAAIAISVWSCTPADFTDHELLVIVEQFENRIDGKTPEEIRPLVKDLGLSLVGRHVRIDAAVVAAVYERVNESQIYFGTTYDPKHHVFLTELDPSRDEFFRNHRYWASVVKTYETRQLSFELAIEKAAFVNLVAGEVISFDAEIATVIRGKSVYCRPTEIRKEG